MDSVDEKRLGALSCLRQHHGRNREMHNRIVWMNFADVFGCVEEMVRYAQKTKKARVGIHGNQERAIVRDYRDGYSTLAISKDRGVDIEVVEEIIDRRVRNGR